MSLGASSHCCVGLLESQSCNEGVRTGQSACTMMCGPCRTCRRVSEAHIQEDIAHVPASAVGALVHAHVQALAQAHVVQLLPAARQRQVGPRPHQQPVLVHGHIAAATPRELDLLAFACPSFTTYAQCVHFYKP
jgi:hypothetical protein